MPDLVCVYIDGESLGYDGFGTRIVMVNSYSPNLLKVILDEVYELVSGFLEGQYAIKCLSAKEMVYVVLSDSLVDHRPETPDSEKFHCLERLLPPDSFEDILKRIVAAYDVEVGIVTGPEGGLLLKRTNSNRW